MVFDEDVLSRVGVEGRHGLVEVGALVVAGFDQEHFLAAQRQSSCQSAAAGAGPNGDVFIISAVFNALFEGTVIAEASVERN